MAKEKNVTISPETMAFYESLQDGGFQQAAIAAGQPSMETTPTTSQTTSFDNVRDYGFEQASIAAGQPFIPVLPKSSVIEDNGDEDGGDGDDDKGDGNGDDKGDGKDTYTATDGKKFTDINSFNLYQQGIDRQRIADERAEAGRKSAFDILREEFNRYGLGFMVEDSVALAKSGISEDEYSIKLRNLPSYKQRFGANAKREAAGLSALTPAEYLSLEDQFQRTMRQYGLPKSFYEKTGIGNQPELDALIGADVSPSELEDRIQVAVERVNNASPETLKALEDFYPGINKSNIVAYVLDPQRALPLIQRQVRAAELGGEALRAGLSTGLERAQELERMGVTQGQAREGFQQISGGLQRGSQLAAIYRQDPYVQETAEQEIFGMTGATEARKRRQKIIKSEEATFGGQTGLTGGALSRDRAGQY
jgi:hypothetical protein